MLINATQEEELRMAMVDGQRLYDLNIELPASERKKANIYKGQITRIEPSLEAAFVNYGAERHGFLPLKEISSEYFVNPAESGGKPNIRDVLREGQDIVVQIDKEERGNKGAALTTYVSLAGRFIVLKPNKSRSGGVSRRIVGEDRDLARKSLRDVDVPKGMSVILRTAGIDRSAEELKWDLDNLLQIWEAIKKVVVERPSPFLIYRESNAVVRALRDYLTNDIGEILIDDEDTFKEAQEFVEQVMPHNLRKLKHYADPVALFTRYQIESQIESAFSHSVTLPSGGSLVIDHTEALVSIDINSARATKGGDIETTALNTNVEAADEIARQLRLRDLGGLVVIDFIDMGPQKNQREVENRLREAVRQDRARVQLGKISRFGLLEMSRQRLRPSLGESSYLVCPRCSGIGNIRSVESLALAILRIIGEEARKERTSKVIAQLPVEVATYLLNEKRDWVQSLESRHGTQVILVANPALETPHYDVRRVRDDQVDLPENAGTSYSLADSEDEPPITQTMQDKRPAEVAAITTVVQTTPAPPRVEPESPGLIERIASLFSKSDDEPKRKKAQKAKSGKSRSRSEGRRRSGQGSRRRGEGQQRQEKSSQQRSRKKTSKKKAKKKAAGRDGQRKDPQQSSAKPKQDQRDDSRQSGSKRRSRGGRRRKRTGESGAAAAAEAPEQRSAGQDEQQAPTPRPADKPGRTERAERKETAKVESGAPENETAKAESGAADKETVKADSSAPERTSTDDKRQRSEAKSRRPASDDKPAAQAPATDSDAAQKPASAEPKKKPSTRKPSAKKAGQDAATDASYDQTQPELPRLKPSSDEASGSAKADSPSGNGENRPPREEAPKPAAAAEKPKGEAKPEGRLLPWEPAGSATESTTDKE
jgi:ribonuclease E